MLFWWTMLGSVLVFPVLLVIFGRIFMNRPPRRINHAYGYRTHYSMLNQETWDFAHRDFGRRSFRLGIVLAAVGTAFMLLYTSDGENVVGAAGCGFMVAEVIVFFISVAQTERALRQRFDRNGRRK